MGAVVDQRGHEGGASGAVVSAGWRRRRETIALRIEAVALDLMAKREFVTVEEIAEASGVSRRTFYRYFSSTTDFIIAPLRRNLDTWAEAFRARPVSESVIVSFYSATLRSLADSDEIEGVRQALQLMSQSHDYAMRAHRAMRDYTINLYRDLIIERLRARGQDTRPAGAVAAALGAVMFQVAEDCAEEGVMLSLDRIDQALSVLVTLLADDEVSIEAFAA